MDRPTADQAIGILDMRRRQFILRTRAMSEPCQPCLQMMMPAIACVRYSLYWRRLSGPWSVDSGLWRAAWSCPSGRKFTLFHNSFHAPFVQIQYLYINRLPAEEFKAAPDSLTEICLEHHTHSLGNVTSLKNFFAPCQAFVWSNERPSWALPITSPFFYRGTYSKSAPR